MQYHECERQRPGGTSSPCILIPWTPILRRPLDEVEKLPRCTCLHPKGHRFSLAHCSTWRRPYYYLAPMRASVFIPRASVLPRPPQDVEVSVFSGMFVVEWYVRPVEVLGQRALPAPIPEDEKALASCGALQPSLCSVYILSPTNQDIPSRADVTLRKRLRQRPIPCYIRMYFEQRQRHTSSFMTVLKGSW